MPVHRTLYLLPKGNVLRRGFRLRTFSGVVAILFLMLQLLAPSLASAAKGDWLEICSEYGVVLMQVDVSDADGFAQGLIGSGTTDCKDCTFCAFAAPMGPSMGLEFELAHAFARQTTRWAEPAAPRSQRYQWPESRGPPTQNTSINAERNSCASIASPYKKGGAPWT